MPGNVSQPVLLPYWRHVRKSSKQSSSCNTSQCSVSWDCSEFYNTYCPESSYLICTQLTLMSIPETQARNSSLWSGSSSGPFWRWYTRSTSPPGSGYRDTFQLERRTNWEGTKNTSWSLLPLTGLTWQDSNYCRLKCVLSAESPEDIFLHQSETSAADWS